MTGGDARGQRVSIVRREEVEPHSLMGDPPDHWPAGDHVTPLADRFPGSESHLALERRDFGLRTNETGIAKWTENEPQRSERQDETARFV